MVWKGGLLVDEEYFQAKESSGFVHFSSHSCCPLGNNYLAIGVLCFQETTARFNAKDKCVRAASAVYILHGQASLRFTCLCVFPLTLRIQFPPMTSVDDMTTQLRSYPKNRCVFCKQWRLWDTHTSLSPCTNKSVLCLSTWCLGTICAAESQQPLLS